MRLIATALLLVLALAGCTQATAGAPMARQQPNAAEQYLTDVLQPPRDADIGRLSPSLLHDVGSDVCAQIGEPGQTPVTATAMVRRQAGLTGGDAMRVVIAAQYHLCIGKSWDPYPVLRRTPAGPASSMADSTHEVGVDVQPGKYRTPGGDRCHWTRRDGAGGVLDEIATNHLADRPQVVTIKAGEQLQSRNCGTWTQER
jgi:hypothetical protein